MKHAPLLLAWASILCAAASGPPRAVETEPLQLIFGVYQTDKATAIYRQFTPILESLQARMELDLDRSVDIQLRIHRTYDECIDALVDGRIDFARFGPASYVIAQLRSPGIALLAMEEKNGKKRFQGAIVVRVDSAIQTVEDLAGASFAFGDANSTIGRYLSQAILIRHGIHANDLRSYSYLGRHDVVAKAVEVGDFDAGALKLSTLKKVNKHRKLRVLVEFENVTKPWIARTGMPVATRDALTAALLALTDRDALATLKATRLVSARSADYDFVRSEMKIARGFEKGD